MHSRKKIEIPTTPPHWSRDRIISEACHSWNLRHADLCDPAKSDWDFICAVVHRWLRHSFTRYDEALREGHDREGGGCYYQNGKYFGPPEEFTN